MGRSTEVEICARPACLNTFTRLGRKKYCCHWCNIKHLNDMRTPEYNSRQWSKYYAENHTRMLERAAERRSRLGRLELNRRHREWYQKDPSKIQAIQAKRRSNKAAQTPSIDAVSSVEWRALIAAWGYRCAYCRRCPDKVTQDHVVPISKGGSHTLDNLLPSCQSCNTAKKDMEVSDFLISSFLTKRIARVDA